MYYKIQIQSGMTRQWITLPPFEAMGRSYAKNVWAGLKSRCIKGRRIRLVGVDKENGRREVTEAEWTHGEEHG